MRCGPRRIACLTAETVDILYRLGVEDRIVGVSGFTQFPPEARRKPFVSAFTTIHYEKIESLQPDLVICFSDLQAEAARKLTRRGFNVLVTNQRTLQEMLETIALLGRIVGRGREAEALTADLEDRLNVTRENSAGNGQRPRVFFEEWDEPLITGIAWVSELIVAAGGDDVFPELSGRYTASQRIVTPQLVIERAPDIIIASWCGKRADLGAIRARPGWTAIPAVWRAEVYEIEAKYCLQPGPSLIVEGLPRLAAIIDGWRSRNSCSDDSAFAELPQR